MAEETINILCLACGEPSFIEPDADIQACPHCGDTGLPADLDDTVTVTLTAHELRVLTFWSEAFSKDLIKHGYDPEQRTKKVLKTIVDRLSMQTDVALSQRQEMADLRALFQNAPDFKLEGMVLVDLGTGKCAECGEQLDVTSPSLFQHLCSETDIIETADLEALLEGTADEPATNEEDTPPHSS